MGLFSFLSGKMPEDMEQTGDKFFKTGEFGCAKIEYEKAVNKAQNKFPEKENLIHRLKEKIKDSKEALAKKHLQNSEYLNASENFSEIQDLLELAWELTENADLKETITNRLINLRQGMTVRDPHESQLFVSGSEPFPTSDEIDSDEEYFSILSHALPEEVANAYQGYDRTFKQGYVALNNGDFELAAEKFTESINRSGNEQPLVPLELSTAWIHMGEYGRARELLEAFIEENTQEVRAYQMLCDVYWVTEKFDDALSLIEQCPLALKETFPLRMLLGETCYQMGEYHDAEALFLECESRFGQNEIITRALAKTYESMGSLEKARDTYCRILNDCTKCGVRTDPFVKGRYAELCFACGDRSSKLLDIYLSLVQEDPDSQTQYYQRIHELYNALGNKQEAARYQSFMQK